MIYFKVDVGAGSTIEETAREMVRVANRLGICVKASFNGIEIHAFKSNIDEEDNVKRIVKYYQNDLAYECKYRRDKINNYSLEDVLKKMGYQDGKMRFPCYHPVIKKNEFGRYIEYRAFRSILDPCHKCSIMLDNLFA